VKAGTHGPENFSAREVFENTEGVLESIYERLPNPLTPLEERGEFYNE
jgi:hypothetical protein